MYLRHSASNGWEIAWSLNSFYTVEILPSTVLSSQVIWLHIKQQQKPKQMLFIVRDALSDSEFRRLKVQLKIQGINKSK